LRALEEYDSRNHRRHAAALEASACSGTRRSDRRCRSLEDGRYDFAFNIAEGRGGDAAGQSRHAVCGQSAPFTARMQ
jgi:hypothetical protein